MSPAERARFIVSDRPDWLRVLVAVCWVAGVVEVGPTRGDFDADMVYLCLRAPSRDRRSLHTLVQWGLLERSPGRSGVCYRMPRRQEVESELRAAGVRI